MSDCYKDPRWQKTRLEIMERDGWRCVACGDAKSTLNVHHKRYEGNPWDVAREDLQTLCEKCHEAFGPHPKGGVWWDKNDAGNAFIAIAWCPNCAGKQFTDKGSYFKCLKCSWRSDCYSNFNHDLLATACISEDTDPRNEPITNEAIRSLQPFDREVIEMLFLSNATARIVCSRVDRSELKSQEASEVFDAAMRLFDTDVGNWAASVFAEIKTDRVLGIAFKIFFEKAKFYDPTNEHERIEHFLKCLKRRAAERQAHASAQQLKTSRLDPASEAALLEKLVVQRRAAQGMTNHKEVAHGR